MADAVLYEGYVLYPYRASAQKNQLRWQFGVLAPPDYARSSGAERWSMCSEVIVDPGDRPRLTVRIRCLQLQHRDVESTPDGGTSFTPVDSLAIDGTTVVPWDEAVDREIDLDVLNLLPVAVEIHEHTFTLPSGVDVEVLRDHRGDIVGRTIRTREAVCGLVRITAQECPRTVTADAEQDGGLLRVSIAVENTTPWNDFATSVDRATVMRRSLIAVHTLLAVDDASFISLLEPAEYAEQAVAGCTNNGTFPVMIGDSETNDVMLSSPIILYDFPAIAPESAGEFCDSTEIDEILALRVMTLTDDEKAEARGTDSPCCSNHRSLRRHAGRDLDPIARSGSLATTSRPGGRRRPDRIGAVVGSRAGRVVRPVHRHDAYRWSRSRHRHTRPSQAVTASRRS